MKIPTNRYETLRENMEKTDQTNTYIHLSTSSIEPHGCLKMEMESRFFLLHWKCKLHSTMFNTSCIWRYYKLLAENSLLIISNDIWQQFLDFDTRFNWQLEVTLYHICTILHFAYCAYCIFYPKCISHIFNILSKYISHIFNILSKYILHIFTKMHIAYIAYLTKVYIAYITYFTKINFVYILHIHLNAFCIYWTCWCSHNGTPRVQWNRRHRHQLCWTSPWWTIENQS